MGIAIGPLLGGTLGEISWRGPFFGVSALMAIALIATIVLVEPTPGGRSAGRRGGLGDLMLPSRAPGAATGSQT